MIRAQMATTEDFQKIEMRVGRVVSVEEFPEARNPSYKLTIDLGPHGTRRSSVAVKSWYLREELVDRVVPPGARQAGGDLRPLRRPRLRWRRCLLL